jgi:hypothetical protein
MLDFLPQEYFEGTDRFVVLDDTVYRGRQMKKHVKRLESLGVAKGRITTAAIVVHDKSEFKPDIVSRTLNDRDYIKWKECFTKLVRTQRRSTDRDHPLYFFEIAKLSSGQLLSILQNIGDVTSIDHRSYGAVYAFAVNMDSRIFLADGEVRSQLWEADGLRLEDLCKIRLYWEESGNGLSLTFVPMAFSTITMDALLSKHPHMFERLTGLDISALDYLKRGNRNACFGEDAWGRFAYFLLSRGIAAKVLEQFLVTFGATVKLSGATIKRLDADEQDWPIHYVFPEPYNRFYSDVTKRVDSILRKLDLSPEQPLLFQSGSTAKLKRTEGASGYVGSGLPYKYDLLRALYHDVDPAVFNGREWVPNEACSRGVTFSSFVAEVRDPLLVSRGLDELLDAGLLRAGDNNIAGVTESPVYSRTFRPGGEFNAVLVNRLALSCRAAVNPESDYAEEQFDSWGEE